MPSRWGGDRITGQVDIPWARILVKSLPESAVAVSDDVTVVYDDPPPVPKAAPLPMAIKLAIRLGDDVRLEAMGLKTKVGAASTSARILAAAGGQWPAGAQRRALQGLWPEPHHQGWPHPLLRPLDQPFLNIEAYRDPDTIEDKVTVGCG